MMVKDENGSYFDLDQNTKYEWNEKINLYVASSIGRNVNQDEFFENVNGYFIYKEEIENDNNGFKDY